MNTVKLISEIKKPNTLELGGKGYSLSVLLNNGINVPMGFIILSNVFFNYLHHNNIMDNIKKLSFKINENNFKEISKEIKNLIMNRDIPKKIIFEVEENLNKLKTKNVSIRSSAVSEDTPRSSFAGLFDTFLNINSDINLVLTHIIECWSSLFNERAIIYKLKKKLPQIEGMAVVIQEMVSSDISGITFTTNPMNENSLLIEASFGIGDIIVSGEVEPDDYIISRKTLSLIEKKIGRKDKMSIINRDGEKRIVRVDKKIAFKEVLSNKMLKEIAQVCLHVEKIFGNPQDIEWCISNDKLWLLQSRPITRSIK